MYYTRNDKKAQSRLNAAPPVNIKWMGYKGRLYPTKAQEELIRRTCGCARKVHNLIIDDWEAQYAEHLADPDGGWRKLKEVSAYRNNPDMPYLKEVDSYAFANEKIFVKNAFDDFFSGKAGYPAYKSKHKDKDSYTTSCSHNNISITDDGRYIKLPKLGLVRMHASRVPDVPLRSVTVTMEPSGIITVSFGVEEHVPELPATGSLLAMDLNMGEVTFSDGTVAAQPRHRKKSQKKLAKEQRKLSRKAEAAKKDGRRLSECSNYQKQKRKVAHLHARVANQRSDFQHKLSREIVENQDVIFVEDLCLKGMMKNHSLASSVADAGYGEFLRQLSYKSDRYGKVLVRVGRFFPSTQRCSCCGGVTGPKGLDGLSVREWECPSCGHRHSRDVNAALNVLLAGLDWLLLPECEWERDADGEFVEPWRVDLDVDHYVLAGVLRAVEVLGRVPSCVGLPFLSAWLGGNVGLVLRTAGRAGLACVPVDGAGVLVSAGALD